MFETLGKCQSISFKSIFRAPHGNYFGLNAIRVSSCLSCAIHLLLYRPMCQSIWFTFAVTMMCAHFIGQVRAWASNDETGRMRGRISFSKLNGEKPILKFGLSCDAPNLSRFEKFKLKWSLYLYRAIVILYVCQHPGSIIENEMTKCDKVCTMGKGIGFIVN